MFSEKVQEVWDLWCEVTDEHTGGVGEAHAEYQRFLDERVRELGGNPDTKFGQMTNEEAEIHAQAIREWLATQ
jgi:hypothetical protein